MINEIDILHEGHSGYFACHSGEKSAGFLCVIAYHHKTVVELGETGLNPLSELFVCPYRRSPGLLIQPIRDFQSNVGDVKKVLLNPGAEIAFVTKHHAVMIFPLHILEVMEVVDTCSCHVVGMDDTAYSTDSMEFISIIIHSLRCAVAPVWSGFRIVASHYTAFGSCVLTYLYRLSVDAENIFPTINGGGHILADFLGEPCSQLTTGVELSAANQVWQVVFALMVQTIKQIVLTVNMECLSRYAKSDDFQIGKLGNYTTTRYISELIDTISGEILADSEDSTKFAMKLRISRAIVLSSLVTTNLLIICGLCNFFIYK